MLSVFLTVDTEVWPFTPNWRDSLLSREVEQDIYGVTSDGEFGLTFQIDLLNEYGLKAVYFVESLFASAIGLEPLSKIVRVIQDRGQEVQLHLHTEWLDKLAKPILPGKIGRHLKNFSRDEQTLLIAEAARNLEACGAHKLCAFRAGNYGANFDTLHALARNGIGFDTSHNTCYLNSTCSMPTPEPLLQPKEILGVYEFPISFFCDYPGHYRHAQLCACSSGELENSMLQAWNKGWHSYVLVLHSFELVKRRGAPGKRALPDRLIIKRFRRLCRFLADNRDKFRTAVFSELSRDSIPVSLPTRPLRSYPHLTVRRIAEQLIGRVV